MTIVFRRGLFDDRVAIVTGGGTCIIAYEEPPASPAVVVEPSKE